MSFENKDLLKAGLASATIHGLLVALGCLDIFEPQINENMFLNIELAGAAEMQQALDEYNNRPAVEEQQPNLEITQPEESRPEETQTEQPKPEEIQPEPLREEFRSELEPQQEEIPEEQLTKGPSIVEPQPKPEPEAETESEPVPEPTPEPNPEPESVPELEEQPQESVNALPAELQNMKDEEIRRSEKEKLEKERIEKERQDKLQKEKERRLEKERKRKLREEKIKKKKEAARRRKKRLEAIKRIEKKNKARKNRLLKIAAAAKKNEEVKKQKLDEQKKKKNTAFDQMIKKEKENLGGSSYGKQYGSPNGNGMGHGNGLGSYGDGMGLTDSDAAIISSQIIPHWVVAGGVKNAETLIIRIRIKVKDNGEVPASSIEILDKARYNSDRVFKSAADSARRAILQASPLKIPADKMHLFRDFEFSFNTDKALGVKR